MRPQRSYPREKCIHELFEAQVARSPQAIAVVFEGHSLSYAELNARANQLARYLVDRGVKPDQPVGICVERSLEMVVGLLGILKAGGAYVPLDPGYPRERLHVHAAGCGAAVLLTQERLREKVPASRRRGDRVGSGLEPDRGSDAAEQSGPEGSGAAIRSSGVRDLHLRFHWQPKGVMNEHRACAQSPAVDADPLSAGLLRSRVLQKTPLASMSRCGSSSGTLAREHGLVMARPEGHKDPAVC